MTIEDILIPRERRPSDGTSRRKAAAWAWYQHGNKEGGSGRTSAHHNLASLGASFARHESRFKAEAMKQIARVHGGDLMLAGSLWDCNSCLYDSFEFISLHNKLDRGLTPLHPSATPPGDWHLSRLSRSDKSRRDSKPFQSGKWLFASRKDGSRCNCQQKKKGRFPWPFRFSFSKSARHHSSSPSSKGSSLLSENFDHFHLHQHEHHHHHHHYHHHHLCSVEKSLYFAATRKEVALFTADLFFPSTDKREETDYNSIGKV